MLLIADSGSTKTDWRLIGADGEIISNIKTEGLNPYFLTVDEIASIIAKKVVPKVQQVEHVFFYGAGCGIIQKAQQVKSAIQKAMPFLLQTEVSGDILGAARSLLQDRPGIACILGTGANSCIYNGKTIIENVPSLGYIMADWGSGTVLSKELVALVLQEKLPKEILDDFHDTYDLTRMEILDSIYNKPMANRFLASFTPFLLKHAYEPECYQIIISNFKQFFDYYVNRYENFRSHMKVHITGSVAYYFRGFVLEAASKMDISLGEIIQHPMDGLIDYHLLTYHLQK